MTDRADDFTRLDGAIGSPSDLGSAWIVQSGSWAILSNQARETTASAGNQATAVLEASVSDVEVEATLAVYGSDNGLVGRVADDNNWIAYLSAGSNTYIFKRAGVSSFVQLATSSTAWASGDVIKGRSDSSNLHSVYRNGSGTPECSATDAAGSTNTKHGIRANTDSTTRFTAFSITAIGGGGTTGTLAKTNANDTSAAAGTTTILGTLAKTNANDTSVASGTTTVTGTLAKTNANDIVVASGSTGQATGTVAYTNANDTSVAAGTTTVIGTLARTNANDSIVASGWAGVISGTLARTNNNDTVVASGVVTQPAGVIGPPGGGGARHWSNYGVTAYKKKRIDEVIAAEVKVVEAIQVAEEKGTDRLVLEALLAKLKKLELQLRKLAQESEAARQYIARKRMEDEELEIVMSLLH